MPAGERLEHRGDRRNAVLHLAIQAIDRVVAELTPRYGEDCPVAVVARATWRTSARARTLATSGESSRPSRSSALPSSWLVRH
jgi:precorrin-4 methylase